MPKPVILAETAIVALILVTVVAGQLLAGPERPQPGELVARPHVTVRTPELGREVRSIARTPAPPTLAPPRHSR